MMSQPELTLGSTYIVSSNGVQHEQEIVVNVLTDNGNEVATLAAPHDHHQSVQGTLQVVSSANNAFAANYMASGTGQGTPMQAASVQHMHPDTSLAQQSEQVQDSHSVHAVASVATTTSDSEQKSSSSYEDDSTGQKGSGISWPKQAVLKLISLHKEHQHLFDDPHYKKKSIWEMIGRKLKEDGMPYNWSQVENKWKSLTKRYRDTVDFNTRNSGVLPHTCPFYDELSGAYPYISPHLCSSTTNMNPTAIVITNPIKRTADAMAGLNEADLACLTKKKKYLNQGASSSNTHSTQTLLASQSPDLAVLLRSLHEDRKKQERLKMDRLEKMHKEKMDMFKAFLDVVKDTKSKEGKMDMFKSFLGVVKDLKGKEDK